MESIERLEAERAKMARVREGLDSAGVEIGREGTELKRKSAAAETGLRQIAARAKEALRKKEVDAKNEGRGGKGSGSVAGTMERSRSGGSGSCKSAASSGSEGRGGASGSAGPSRK